MITADAGRRAARLSELQEILNRGTAPEDQQLLAAFVPTFFADLPDSSALGLSPAALAARIADSFRFFAKEMPPSSQLYRGLPGLHVSVRNPQENEDSRIIGGKLLPFETTVVETHTPDAPFIFESLKNYFRRAGLREIGRASCRERV